MLLSELIPAGAVVGSALALRHRGRYLFELSRPELADASETYCAGIGGHCEPGESWLACAQREALEELGVEVAIQPAPSTAHIGREGVPRPVLVEDEPRPLCMHEMWRKPLGARADGQWEEYAYCIVVYQATLADEVEPHPEDLDAILWLTPEQVALTAHTPVPLQALLDDGATIVARVPFPGHWVVRAIGTALALCKLWAADRGSHR